MRDLVDIACAEGFCGHRYCADCGCQIGRDAGPRDGWQIEDGRTVCHECCVEDTKAIVDGLTQR
jgi:hypothetical protein